MKKLVSKIILGCVALGAFSVSITGLTLGWFVGAGGRTDDQAIDGEVGLRGYFYAGDGTAGNPYEIVSPVHFYNLTRLQNLGVFPQKTYFQIGHVFDENDGLRCINPGSQNEYDSYLDMSSISQSETRIIPIGSEATPFVGEFNGNGIPVKNLKVTGYPEDIGVFGYVACTGTVNGLVCEDLEICSLGYNSTSSDNDYQLYHADLDYTFTTAEALFTGSHYLSNDTSLSLYRYNGNAYTETNLKHPNGLGGTTIYNLNAIGNRSDYTYTGAYFKTNFPTVQNDPFSYSWQASSPIIKTDTVLDIDGDGDPDEAIVIDMNVLANSEDFNSGSDMEADVRVSLVASTEVDGYVFSRVIQTYVIEFYSNGDVFSGNESVGNFSASIFCDYSNDVTVGYRATNYHHGNNIGFLAGHVDGNLTNSYVYNGKFTFNENGYTPILTESDTGLVGEIGTNVVNGINPDIGLVTDGDIGIMNFSKIYSLIRDNMSTGHTIYANRGVDSKGGYHSFVSYSDFIKSGDSFANYSEYLRTFDTGLGSSVYITGTDANMYDYRISGYPLNNDSDIKSDFNSVDFIWNKVIEDEDDVDRGLGVFKIVTAKNSGAAAQGAQYSSYALDNIGESRIMNGSEKTKVYFSTAEYDHTKANSYGWGDEAPYRPTTLPSYSDVHSFEYPFSRDFNYCFELDLSEMNKTAGKNYMYNTDSAFLSNYLSSILIDKYGAPVTPGSSRFGFMFRSSENELLTSLSSYMPVNVPNGKVKLLHTDGNYYPANSIVFHVENESGANVSVVGNKSDISIYRNNVHSSSEDLTKLYTMRATNFTDAIDAHRYYTYEVEHTEGNVTTPGKTSTEIVVNNNMSTDNNALYGHIFKLPKGDYVIGASSGTANIYFLAVQGQTDASIGSKDMADIGNSIEKVNFLTTAPTLANYANNALDTTDVTFKSLFNDEVGTEFIVGTKQEDLDYYLSISFSDSPSMFVTYLLTYSPTKQVHFINNTRYRDVNIFYRT